MKRTLHIIAIIFAGFVFILYSCSDDFFETPTGNRVKPYDHYAYSIDAYLSYLGCFVYLQDIVSNQILINGLRSDLMDITDNSDKDIIDINNHELSPTNSFLDLSNFYKVIVNVNEVIPNLPGILEKDRDFDSLTLYQYTGALVTLRSWCYFTLVRLCGEVSIIDSNFISVNPSKVPVYLNKGAVIDMLINDLLPYYDEEDILRFPVDQLALLGELYLEKNDYQNAAFYLKKCVDGEGSNGYMVDKSYSDEDWKNIFINSSGQTEAVISSVPFSFWDGQPNPLSLLMSYQYVVKPSSVIIDAFQSQVQLNDDPGDLYRGLDITYTMNDKNEPYISKYDLEEIELSADVILYRDADIHLLLAEALNRLGQSENALILLNLGMSQESQRPNGYSKWSKNAGVRGRVSLQALTGSTTESIEDLIIQERALELAFEGKRWFDLIRIANRRNDPSYLANKVAAKFSDPVKSNEIKTKLMNSENWYIPLSKISPE